SVNAANQVVSVGADIAFDADPKFFACLVRFESSSVPTTLPTAYDVYPLDGRHRLLEGTLQAGTSAVSDKLLDLVGLGGKSAADKGKDTRDYLAAAFPELNAWERAGADASSAGMVDAGFENQKELTKMQ